MSDIMMDGQCLMIKTKDRRKFFTHEKNYIQLLEFSKLFKAEVSVVKVKEAEVLDLSQLAPAICDANYVQTQPVEYKVLEVKIAQNKRSRKHILRTAKKIKEYIRKKFQAGELVTLRDLAKTFRKAKVTLACLCNHLTQVRKELEACSCQITKMGGGKYIMMIPSR
jgi:hypothetical protein